MKKWMRMLVVFFCLCGLTACGEENPTEANIYQIYALNNSETKIETHPYEMEADDEEGQLEELLACLATQPGKLAYKVPFAMGFSMLSAVREGTRLQIDVSPEYKNLSPTTEVLVRAAIVRTLTQIKGIRYVGITVDGEQLFDNAGELVGWMGADQFIHNDGNEINTYDLAKVRLYFANEDGDKLIVAYREKYYSTNIPKERFIVEELIQGPGGQVEGLYPTLNQEVNIINVMTKDGICYVNLDEDFLAGVNNVTLDTSIYSIVNSLVELNTVNKVQILINGEVPPVFNSSTFEKNLNHVTTLEKKETEG